MIKGKNSRENAIIQNVYQAGQDHLFRWWEELNMASREKLLTQLEQIDFDLINDLKDLCLNLNKGNLLRQKLDPPDVICIPKTDSQKKEAEKAEKIGEHFIQSGKLGVVVVAGGQGTRLGFQGPKGCFRISPVKKKSLFQMHAEKILAESRAYGLEIPWYILTSETNDKAIQDFFKKNLYFGLRSEAVFFMQQRTLPALNKKGKCILDAKDHVFSSPNGHGGVLSAMVDSGATEDMVKRGIEILSYFQVDNPLIRLIDPIFIGYHIQKKAEMSSKMLRKMDPMEKVGHFVKADGKLKVIEYSDMSETELQTRNPDGTLKFEAGSIGIHLINRDFINQVVNSRSNLPFHVARKKIPYLDEDGHLIHPEKPNGYKFEMFVFDALQDTTQSVIMEIIREEEFSPLKNKSGNHSLELVQRDISNYFGSWLESAGMSIPRDNRGNVAGDIEISPLYARNREEFLKTFNSKIQFAGSLYLGPSTSGEKNGTDS